MRPFVAVVICAVLLAPSAEAARHPSALADASRLSGLRIRKPVRKIVESPARFRADAARAIERSYPISLRRLDATFYVALGLQADESQIGELMTNEAVSDRAFYDPVSRAVRTLRSPAPSRAELVDAYVDALVDQNFGLRRLTKLRAHNRDAYLAADDLVDGLASLASHVRATGAATTSSPLARFLSLLHDDGQASGRALVANLRYLGGRFAVGTALRRFPQTTAQLLHLDLFLERARVQAVALAPTIATLRLTSSETFGELDARSLLSTFAVPDASTAADGWAGGRIALYTDDNGETTVALALRFDDDDAAAQWKTAETRLLAAAFPGAVTHDCPAVDHCWTDGEREVALTSQGSLTVLGSGAAGELVAAALLH